jgi:basic membrane protein A and related proteins
VLDGSWKSGSVWGGVREGMIRVDSFRQPRCRLRCRLRCWRGSATWPPAGCTVFGGGKNGVKDNEGKTVIAAGQSLDDGAILGMNWLVEGVLTRLPR